MSDVRLVGIGGMEEGCLPCQDFLGGPKPAACAAFQDYITPEEEEILSTLRRLKGEVRELQGKIRGMDMALKMTHGNGAFSQGARGAGEGDLEASRFMDTEMKECVEQLEQLRVVWKEWEQRRDKAQRRKMALLGHAPWDDAMD